MLTVLDHEWVQGNRFLYKDCGKIKAGKTNKYEVYNITNRKLVGFIKWYVPWKQYTFFSIPFMFQWSDLNEIAEVCRAYTQKYKDENFKERKFKFNKTYNKKPKQERLFSKEHQDIQFIRENY